jgi:methylated-DNA-[protein]-cysteine S-methyltransferase
MKLWLERVPSPIGTILLVPDDESLRALDFEDYEHRMLRLLHRNWGECTTVEPEGPTRFARQLQAYFDGDPAALNGLPVRTGGTTFQQLVWKALREIPPGTTTTYGALAASIGKPTATRAVGTANGVNPVAIVVPCHRVIGADSQPTGYAGGIARREWLLRHEGVDL